MRKCLLRRQPLLWLPFDAFINKVNEVPVGTVHDVVKILSIWHSNLSSRVWSDNWIVIIIEEHFSPGRSGKNGSWWNTLDLHHECHVVLFILSWEQWIANVQLVEDAAKTPHVNGSAIGDAEDNLWRSIESRLDIRINLLILKTATAKIDDLNT